MGLKVPFWGIFRLELKKTIVIFKISTCKFSIIAKLGEEPEMPEFGTKNALSGIFDKNVLFGYFRAKSLKKTIVIFEISTLKFVYLQNFTKNKNA